MFCFRWLYSNTLRVIIFTFMRHLLYASATSVILLEGAFSDICCTFCNSTIFLIHPPFSRLLLYFDASPLWRPGQDSHFFIQTANFPLYFRYFPHIPALLRHLLYRHHMGDAPFYDNFCTFSLMQTSVGHILRQSLYVRNGVRPLPCILRQHLYGSRLDAPGRRSAASRSVPAPSGLATGLSPLHSATDVILSPLHLCDICYTSAQFPL